MDREEQSTKQTYKQQGFVRKSDDQPRLSRFPANAELTIARPGFFGTPSTNPRERVTAEPGIFGRFNNNSVFSATNPLNIFGLPHSPQNIFQEKSQLNNQSHKLIYDAIFKQIKSLAQFSLIGQTAFQSRKTSLPNIYNKKLSTLNSCTNKIFSKNNDKFIQCFQCCGTSYVICESCFKYQDHQGHYYYQASLNSNLNLQVCMCGKDNLKFLRDRVFITCDKHCSQCADDEDLQYNKSEFIDYYGSLLAIGIYVFVENRRSNRNYEQEKRFLEILIHHLSQLAQGSSQNIRVITEVLNFPCKSKFLLPKNLSFLPIDKTQIDQERPIFTYLLHHELSQTFSPLLEDLLSDDFSAKKIINLMKIEEEKLFNSYGQRFSIPKFAQMELIFRLKLVQQMLNCKLFAHLNDKSTVRFVQIANSHYQQLIEYISFTTDSQFCGVVNCKRNEFIFENFRMSRTLKYLCPFLLSSLLRQFASTINLKMGKMEIEILQIVINKLVISFCEYKVEKILDFRILYQQSFNCEFKEQEYAQIMNNLQIFVEWGIQNFKNIHGDVRHSRMIAFQYLALKSSKKKEHFLKLARLCLNDMETILLFIRLGMWKLYFKSADLQSPEERLESIEYRQRKLIEHLYEVKKYNTKMLCHFQKFFQVPSFPTIVREYLSFDNESKLFFYNEREKYPNKLMRLFDDQVCNEVSFFNLSDANIFEEFFENPTTRELFQELFINSNLLEESTKYNQSSGLFNPVHLQLAVIVNLMTKGRSQLAVKELAKIRDDVELLQARDEQCIRIINEVLCVSMNYTSRARNQMSGHEQMRESFMERAKLKKAQKFLKFKEKQEMALKKHCMSPSSEEGQSCLICKQKGKHGNELIYLIQINSGQSFSSFFGEIDKMKTRVSTCFHPMHASCFLVKFSLKSPFNCILCGQPANCIAPQTYDSSHLKINKICENALIVSFYCSQNTLQTESMFSLFFKHLIESKLFASLTNIHQRQKTGRKKSE